MQLPTYLRSVLAVYFFWLACLICIIVLAGWQLRLALKNRAPLAISQSSEQASTALWLLNVSTGGISRDIQFAQKATELLASNYPLLDWAVQLSKNPFIPTQSPLASSLISPFATQLSTLAKLCSHAYCENLTTVSTVINQFEPQISKHLETSHTYIVLFQNADEIRASGGFMGSYAKITINGQGIQNIEIQDIYEPDGQFTGFVPAPPGVAEYLSAGQGLRLPDANWAADFPSAAQTILSYFSFGKQQSINGLIAINSSLIEKMLTVTGDIYLPDYNVNVSASNFNTVARANRDTFFPGSKQKQHFLTSFMNQLKTRLTDLSTDQQLTLLKVINDAQKSKDILAYSTDPNLQQLLRTYQIAGAISPPSPAFIYSLESNVGINKANYGITRQADLTITPSQLILNLSISNQHPASSSGSLDYANYHRLVVPTSWQLEKVLINTQPQTTWHQQLHTPTNQTAYQELGFLVGVPAGMQTTITATFTNIDLITNPTLSILKQPGIPPTPYTINWQGESSTILVDQDIHLPLRL